MADPGPTAPALKPSNPRFSSGPCAKRPGWSPEALAEAPLARSHRSAAGKTRIVEVIERSRALLGLPLDYRLAVVPASDTGAVEMALWSLLGPRGVDVLAWESFGKAWAKDITGELKIADTRVLEADYGRLSDLGAADPARDTVFTWNGTTSGVRVPDGDWIAAGREGLTICDATSAVFAMDLPWDKLDVVTWSWQKALGGEAAHGMLALSPRAVARLESHEPAWPLPKVFRMTKGGKLIESLFQGATINTPSLLCVEDQVDALTWAEAEGGLAALIGRAEANLAAVADWAAARDWVDFLAEDPATRSCTSICLKLTDAPAETAPAMTKLLAEAGAALDIGSYRDAPPGLRIWGGPTVELADIEALLPWLDWAFAKVRAGQLAEA